VEYAYAMAAMFQPFKHIVDLLLKLNA
jgi:5-methyltetrahydropteroyltriglutamate--homocysteine methyltransferase